MDYENYTDDQLLHIREKLGSEKAAYAWRQRENARQERMRVTQAGAGLTPTGRNLAGDPTYKPPSPIPLPSFEKSAEPGHVKMFQEPGMSEQEAQRKWNVSRNLMQHENVMAEAGRRLPTALASSLTTGIAAKSPIAGAIEGGLALALPPETPGQTVVQVGAGPLSEGAGKLARLLGGKKGGAVRKIAAHAGIGALEGASYTAGADIIDKGSPDVTSAALGATLGLGAGAGGGFLAYKAGRFRFNEIQEAYRKADLEVPKTAKALEKLDRKQRMVAAEMNIPGSAARRQSETLQQNLKTLEREKAEAHEAIKLDLTTFSTKKGQIEVANAAAIAKQDRDLAILGQRVEHAQIQQRKLVAGQEVSAFDVRDADKAYNRRRVDFTDEERVAAASGDAYMKTLSEDVVQADTSIATLRSQLAENLADTTRSSDQKLLDRETATRLINDWTEKKGNVRNKIAEAGIERLKAQHERLAKMPRVLQEQGDLEKRNRLYKNLVISGKMDIADLESGLTRIRKDAADVTIPNREKLLRLETQLAQSRAYDTAEQAKFATSLARLRERLAGPEFRDHPIVTSMLGSGTHREVLEKMNKTQGGVFAEYINLVPDEHKTAVKGAVLEKMFADVFVDNKPWNDQFAKLEALLGSDEKATIVTDIMKAAAQTFEKGKLAGLAERAARHTPYLVAFHTKFFTNPVVLAGGSAFVAATSWSRLIDKALDNPKVGRELAVWLQEGATAFGLRASHHLTKLIEDTAVGISPERFGAVVGSLPSNPNLGQTAMYAAGERQRPAQQPAPQAGAQQPAPPPPRGQIGPGDRFPR